MPSISTIRIDITRVVGQANEPLDLSQIVEKLDGVYTRDQVSDALKWLVPSGEICAEKPKRARDNRYFMPTRLRPSPDIEFDRHTVSLSRKHNLDLSGPMGWQLQVQNMLCGWRAAGTASTIVIR